MNSADPSKFMAIADFSSSTMNIELNWGGGVPKIIMKWGPGVSNFMGFPNFMTGINDKEI